MIPTISASFLNKAEAELKQLILAQLPLGCSLKLFGSRARGAHRWNSDFDVLLETPNDIQITRATLTKIQDNIDESWVPFHVDIVTAEQCTGAFGMHVKSEAKPWN